MHQAADRVLREELKLLQQRLSGRVIRPGDEHYDAGRKVFNGNFDPHPTAIIYCRTESDVSFCLDTMRRSSIPFSIRSGGHSIQGYSACDGVVIDLTRLNNVSVDPVGLVANVGSGCRQGNLERILSEHGMQLPLGDAPTVSLAGFMQGGGWGITSRTFGMNCDNVLQVRVMLADGRIVQASETVNHDLWWAVRGGTGGNFGVLLGIKYRVHRAPQANYWCFSWPLSQDGDRYNAVSALMELQRLINTAASEFNAAALAVFASGKPGDRAQEPWLVLWGAYVGAQTDMIAALRPLLLVPGCIQGFDRAPLEPPSSAFDRESRYVSRTFTRPDWQAILDFFVAAPTPFLGLHIQGLGGAINAYPAEKSAFVHRSATFNIFLDGFWRDDVEKRAVRSFMTDWCDLMKPFWNGHIYQNFPSANAPDYRSNYWGEAFPALLGVKQKYDPAGLFKFTQAVLPRHGNLETVEWPQSVADWLVRPIAAESCG